MGDTAKIFAPGVVSVENKNTHALSFSPDGKILIFSRYPDRTSYIMTYDSGKWSDPVESFFFGKEVSFSADGNRIFYYTDGDIFYVEKNDGKWSQPIKLGSEINTSETEYYPSVVKSGKLYFSRDGKWDKGRIFSAEYRNGKYLEAVDIGPTVNSGGALHAWVSLRMKVICSSTRLELEVIRKMISGLALERMIICGVYQEILERKSIPEPMQLFVPLLVPMVNTCSLHD